MSKVTVLCGLLLFYCCFNINAKVNISNLDLEVYFQEFQQRFNHFYDASDLEDRRTTFATNLQEIIEHNIKADLGIHSYTLGLQEFSDQDLEEVRQALCGLNATDEELADADGPVRNFLLETSARQLEAASVDWRSSAVTPVKNQGACGSCWVFAAVGSIEAQYFKKSGQLRSLSEQQILDCSGSNGCNGGWPVNAYNYVKRTGGIDSEQCYPYNAKYHGGSCSYQAKCAVTTVTGYVNVAPTGSEDALAKAVSKVGPVAVAIYSSRSFMQYRGGIFYDKNCTPRVNHAVLVVGYGSENGKDYWIVKNSWGKQWGEEGYVRMARNRNNMCHIASYCSYATV